MGRGTGGQEGGDRDSGVRISLTSKARPGYFSLHPPGLPYEVPRVPTGYDPWGFFGPTAPVLPGTRVDRREESGIHLDIPPQGLSGDPLGPHGLRPVGFFFWYARHGR